MLGKIIESGGKRINYRRRNKGKAMKKIVAKNEKEIEEYWQRLFKAKAAYAKNKLNYLLKRK